LSQVKQKLVDSGMKIAAAIPAINPTFALFKSQDLAKAQTAYSVLNALRWILPIVSLVLLAGGVLLARARATVRWPGRASGWPSRWWCSPPAWRSAGWSTSTASPPTG
jgi:hypothetical protein